MRQRAAVCGVVCTALLLMSGSTATASSQAWSATVAGQGGGTFAAPAAEQRPRLRWWWPGAWAEPGEVKREVDAMADAGFGGFEIADVRDSVLVPMDPRLYGWGTPRWNAAVQAALEQAAERGLKADITVGPHWPASVPGVTPDDPAAAKELVWGQATVPGGQTFDGALPQPANRPSGVALGNPSPPVTPELIAVHVARAVSDPAVTPVQLDASTLTEVTSQISNGRLTWAAPEGGTWLVIAEYARGTGQIQRLFDFSNRTSPLTEPQSYVIDHFGTAGAEAVIAYWEQNLLPSRTRALLRRIGGSFFEDSLELRSDQHWTPSLLREFRGRRGYSLRPLLPLALTVAEVSFLGVEPGPPAYTFGDDTGDRVQHDYEQTLSDLYIDSHLAILRRWARTLNMSYRVQPYGGPVDSALAAATVDIPEGESLGFAANPDAYRVLAAGRDLGRRRLLSDELGAFLGAAYQVTLAQLQGRGNHDYAVGVNQAVIHGFAYRDSPDSQWPGFHAFAPIFLPGGFAEAWGPRQPAWTVMPDLAAYLGRSQTVLQAGRQKTDVAIYDPEFDASQGDPTGGTGPLWNDPALRQAGYTYQFPSPETLLLPNAVVRAGRLDPGGPAYKALIVRGEESMRLDAARRILSYARAGLPVLLVGELPTRTPSLYRAVRRDAELRAVLAALTRQAGFTRVAALADVPGALTALGVRPAVEPGTATELIAVQRRHGPLRSFWLHNGGTRAVDGSVSLEGAGRPFAFDAASGKVRALAEFTAAGGRVRVPLALAPSQATVIFLAPDSPFVPRPVVTDSAADARYDGGRLVLRAQAPGVFDARLADGRTARATIESVGPTRQLASWHLSVQDWRPANPGAVGPGSDATVKVEHALDLAALAPWTELPGLQDVSGIGTYSTTVDLGPGWTGGHGAYLDLGEVGGSFRVTVNGRRLPAGDQLETRLDVGPYLHSGVNTIEIEVATTLHNRLRTTRPDVFGSQPAQRYGLLGPVTLIPYGEAPLSR